MIWSILRGSDAFVYYSVCGRSAYPGGRVEEKMLIVYVVLLN